MRIAQKTNFKEKNLKRLRTELQYEIELKLISDHLFTKFLEWLNVEKGKTDLHKTKTKTALR